MLVWNDIAKYTNDYKNGIKKLDDIVNDADKAQNNKLNYKKNKFKLHSSTDDYGLDDKITIRSMKFKTSNDLKDMFKNKSTPSNLLKGKVELSSGTKNVINMQNKMIPKIDHSYIDPGYYEHKLEGKTNKDLMLKELSSGKDFAKQYVAGLPKRTELLESISKSSPTSTSSTTLQSSPSPTPSTSTRLNNVINTDIGELDDKTKSKMNARGFGNRTNQTLTIGQVTADNINPFNSPIPQPQNPFQKHKDFDNENEEHHKKLLKIGNKAATTIQKNIRIKQAQNKNAKQQTEPESESESDKPKIQNKKSLKKEQQEEAKELGESLPLTLDNYKDGVKEIDSLLKDLDNESTTKITTTQKSKINDAMSKFGKVNLITNTNIKEKKVIKLLLDIKTDFNNNIQDFETSGRMSNLSGDKSSKKKKSSEIELK